MRRVFGAPTRRFGTQRGYQAGFAIYWAACRVITRVLVGPGRLSALLAAIRGGFSWPSPGLRRCTVRGADGCRRYGVPATCACRRSESDCFRGMARHDQRSSRGVAVAGCPDRHLPQRAISRMALARRRRRVARVPVSTRPTTARRRTSVLTGAALIGLSNGWIAQRTRSLAVVTTAHALTDSCGVRAARDVWLTRGS